MSGSSIFGFFTRFRHAPLEDPAVAGRKLKCHGQRNPLRFRSWQWQIQSVAYFPCWWRSGFVSGPPVGVVSSC